MSYYYNIKFIHTTITITDHYLDEIRYINIVNNVDRSKRNNIGFHLERTLYASVNKIYL